jgi:hypothetical protein
MGISYGTIAGRDNKIESMSRCFYGCTSIVLRRVWIALRGCGGLRVAKICCFAVEYVLCRKGEGIGSVDSMRSGLMDVLSGRDYVYEYDG